MVSTEVFVQVVTAFVDGDDVTLERLEQAGVPVSVVLFLTSMGGGAVMDDVGLLERLG
jgi:hypothetical protein